MTAPRLFSRALLSRSVLIAASLLASNSGWGFSSARPRMDLVIATSYRPTSPDARTWAVPSNRPLLSWIHDTLFEMTYLDSVPRLRTVLAAERGSWDSTRTILTLRIKSGASFSTGEPITAMNFIASWESLASLPKDSVPQRLFLSRVQKFESHGSETLVLKLYNPDPEFEKILTLPFTAPIALNGGVLAKSIFSVENFSATQSLPGFSGPFVLTDWHPGFGLMLRARQGYSNSFYPAEASSEYRDLGYLQQASKPLPQIDGIRVDWTENENAAWKRFSEGQADLIDVDPNFAAEVFEAGKPWLLQSKWSAKGIKLEKGWRPRFSLALLNLKTLPDVELRKKILSQLNREFWSQVPGFADHSLPRLDLSSLPQLDDWLDVGAPRTKIRLNKPGREVSTQFPKRPLRLELVGTDAQANRILELAQQQLEKAGFAPESKNAELDPAIERFRHGETDVLIIGWNWDVPTWRSVLDPVLWLQPEGVPDSKEFRSILAVISSPHRKPDEKARELNSILEKMAVWSPGPRHHRETLVQPWVFGFHIHPAVQNPERFIRVDRELRKNYLGH